MLNVKTYIAYVVNELQKCIEEAAQIDLGINKASSIAERESWKLKKYALQKKMELLNELFWCLKLLLNIEVSRDEELKRLLDGAVHNLSKQNLIKVKAKTLKHVEDQLDIAEDEIVCE